ncbi:FAD binding domain-containing protein [Aspergillus keveii]|uniref:FAD binding domain-containing protein n=1 Tax=Aspergillus keveii TaxID=714993 RepID=A0ABR4FGJ1_9EURO
MRSCSHRVGYLSPSARRQPASTGLLEQLRELHILLSTIILRVALTGCLLSYFPPVLEEFEKAGIIQDVIDAGDKISDGCDWRDANGTHLAGITPPPNDTSFAVCLSQPELADILLGKLREISTAEIFFNQPFRRLEQHDGHVTYWTESPDGGPEIERTCQYLIGADGGRSSVRRGLGIGLEGFTFESLQFVAVNFQYPLRELGWKAANYIVDPVDWGIVVKRGKGTSWRFATGMTSDGERKYSLDEATIQVIKDRLGRILPGDTTKIQYEDMAPYVVHQRCATRFREGNVLLAGDAAHLNAPVGGLGLTTGLLDAAHLVQELRKVLLNGEDPEALTTYADTRRWVFLNRTNPTSIGNLLRLHSQEPAHVQERKEVLARLNDPTDFVAKARYGLPDYTLTSTSAKIFDTYGEVTWFISVTRIPEWAQEKFTHEYKTVHADMTRKGNEHAPVISRYIQLANSKKPVPKTEQPSWDYVTCLTWPSLFVLYAGFQNPDYRATAGAHVFCRQDQEGCLMTQVEKFSRGRPEDEIDVGAVQCLVYHKREKATDGFSSAWFTERAAKLRNLVTPESQLQKYILWRDVTPKKVDYLFHNTQFSRGSWLQYKAVETFIFEDENAAIAFLERHSDDIFNGSPGLTTTVVGVPDRVI